MMDLLDLVLAVEQGSDKYTPEEIIDGIQQHKDQLVQLQGFWGRLVADLTARGEIS